ncbi:MAG: hypothetical protein ACREDL_10690 [Bradyrhizobium sp.]
MTPAAPGLQIADAAFRGMDRGADGLRELFLPLDHLLVRGVDQPAMPDSGSGCNNFGCNPNLERQIDHIAAVVAKIELSVAHTRFAEACHGS